MSTLEMESYWTTTAVMTPPAVEMLLCIVGWQRIVDTAENQRGNQAIVVEAVASEERNQ